MPIDVLMPQLSPTMTEGRLANWLKQEGDEVSAGDIIAEVETDKATMEVEATEDGIVHQIIGQPGADIQVGTPIAVLKENGEEVPADYQPTSQAAAPEPEVETPQTEEAQPTTQQTAAPAVSGMVAVPTLPKVNTGTSPAPVVAQSHISADGRVKASPLARRLAAMKGVALNAIAGSGPNGRIVSRDVMKAKAAPGLGVAQPVTRQPDTAEKLSPMRKAIATRLTAAKQHVPHFYLNADVQLDAALDTRKQLNALAAQQAGEGKSAYKLTVNDFVLKACACALADHPAANAAWAEDSIVNFGNVDVSVAVSIDGGLITPIVFNADQKPIIQVSQEVKQLAADARTGKLKPEQYEGGSFSLSNLGMYGVKQFSAIVNPPQAAILAVGAGEKRPVVQADGQLGTATVMGITLSVDHRVIDGSLGAELLSSIKFYLENPATMLV
ncbi:MAG: pyruvate dehydrogenase complex dihydrolipoamide acetyltransferase [Alphaproteobacteria bacterium]|nr:pyruvate dehydrogenase complex dihydrolipoamide acetyltransferase [Alphaproteobacteria bacterium]MDD9920107.1 pyruvate dehydrogenase complex dihydrolipoamide acetyltransferase [Alphaproteobacteria bacterium]